VLPSVDRDIERGGGDDDDNGGDRAATTSSEPHRPDAPPDSIIRRRKPLKLRKGISTWPTGVRSPFLEYFTRRAGETDRPFCVFLTWNSGDGHRGIDIPVDDPRMSARFGKTSASSFRSGEIRFGSFSPESLLLLPG
jgi:hypothetical protein